MDRKTYVKAGMRVISLVGGGGKTTTMYALAKIFSEAGKKVVVTTSTHLQIPPKEIRARDIEELRSFWKSGRYAVIGTDFDERKMSMPNPEFLKEVLKEAEVVLIEADGAKHLPCKVPIEKEPVIIPECTDVIAVVGMDALGKPLRDVCFRKEAAVNFLNTDETHQMTEEDIAKILLSEQGAKKSVGFREYFVLLNKCDDTERRRCAEQIRSLLESQGEKKVILTSGADREEELRKHFL